MTKTLKWSRIQNACCFFVPRVLRPREATVRTKSERCGARGRQHGSCKALGVKVHRLGGEDQAPLYGLLLPPAPSLFLEPFPVPPCSFTKLWLSRGPLQDRGWYIDSEHLSTERKQGEHPHSLPCDLWISSRNRSPK